MLERNASLKAEAIVLQEWWAIQIKINRLQVGRCRIRAFHAERCTQQRAKSKAFKGHEGYCLPRRWGLAPSGSVLRQGVISIPPLR